MTRRALLVLLCALGVPTTAVFADSPLEPPDLSRYVRWGPIRARPNISITNLGYDNNVFFTNGDEGAEGDYRMTLGGRLEGLTLFGDRAFLEFDARLNYTMYQTFTEQNFWNRLLTSRITFPFRGGWGVFADLDLIETENRPTSEFDNRVKLNTKRVGFGFVVELGWRTYLEYQRSASELNYDDPRTLGFQTAFKLDRVEQRDSVQIVYRVTGLTSLTLDAVSTDYTFDFATSRDSTQRSILPGFRFGTGSRLSGAVKFGYSRFDLKDPNQDDYDGPIGEVDLAYRLGSGTTLRLEGGREVGFAVFGQNNNFYLNRFGHLRATHFVSSFLGFFVGGGLGQLSFPGSETNTDDERVDDNSEYSIGVLFRTAYRQDGKTMEYGLSWRNTRRDSSDDRYDQTRGTWGFTATAGF